MIVVVMIMVVAVLMALLIVSGVHLPMQSGLLLGVLLLLVMAAVMGYTCWLVLKSVHNLAGQSFLLIAAWPVSLFFLWHPGRSVFSSYSSLAGQSSLLMTAWPVRRSFL